LRAGESGHAPSSLPVVLFSYANPLLRRGWVATARAAAEAGLDGWLVPDLPVEEGAEMRAAALEHGLCPIFFVAPTTSAERARAAMQASRGFLYAIGRFGVTGASTRLDSEATRFLDGLRAHGDLPVAVGFGLAGPEDVRAVVAHADLAIVGSALVEHLHRARGEHARLNSAELAALTGRAARAFYERLAVGLSAPSRPSRDPV
jgi:tryptophan synthase alpha chain